MKPSNSQDSLKAALMISFHFSTLHVSDVLYLTSISLDSEKTSNMYTNFVVNANVFIFQMLFNWLNAPVALHIRTLISFSIYHLMYLIVAPRFLIRMCDLLYRSTGFPPWTVISSVLSLGRPIRCIQWSMNCCTQMWLHPFSTQNLITLA